MKEENKIDKLIRESLKAEKPSLDFTDKIMNHIEAKNSKEELALGSLLKRTSMESPSLNFTDRVMAQIEKASSLVVEKPLISKKIWILISVIVGSIFTYVLLTGEKNAAASEAIDGAVQKVGGAFSNSLSFELPALLTSPIFGLSIFALSSLLFFDYFMRNRKVSVKI
ncbi:hypothetical protein LCM02_00230 [Lutimonas saemankumensis]|uniref:hypothetical protein n=1 Tax=Lutimonas saemankumensis TaxID=483016 RepID=UPI001CD63B63|nr:hypothetical protein [Lutimonas saemankumensis]MCA0930854.1 hypothetical protein [Lutimonas saemankumensis]